MTSPVRVLALAAALWCAACVDSPSAPPPPTAPAAAAPATNLGEPTWVFGIADGSGTQADFTLTRTIGQNLCPGCTGTPRVYSPEPAGDMNSDLQRLHLNRADTWIDASLGGNSTWQRGVELARLVGP